LLAQAEQADRYLIVPQGGYWPLPRSCRPGHLAGFLRGARYRGDLLPGIAHEVQWRSRGRLARSRRLLGPRRDLVHAGVAFLYRGHLHVVQTQSAIMGALTSEVVMFVGPAL